MPLIKGAIAPSLKYAKLLQRTILQNKIRGSGHVHSINVYERLREREHSHTQPTGRNDPVSAPQVITS
jgi:hypothetical protein